MSGPRTLLVGPGAIGGYLAARLTDAGWPLTVLARPETAAALAGAPLRIEEEGRSSRVGLRVVSSLAGEAPFELALVCVKSTGTGAAGRALRGFLTPEAVVLSLQNGVENVGALAGELPGARIGGVAMYLGIERRAADEIVRRPSRRPDGTLADRLVGGPSGPLADALAAVGAASGIPVAVVDRPEEAQWTKLLANVCLNTVTALGRARVGRVFGDPEAVALLLGLGREVEAVARGVGIALPEGAAQAYVDDARRRLPATGGSSTLFDLEAGRPLEHDALVGAVVRAGRRAGVPTPISQACWALLGLLDSAGGDN